MLSSTDWSHTCTPPEMSGVFISTAPRDLPTSLIILMWWSSHMDRSQRMISISGERTLCYIVYRERCCPPEGLLLSPACNCRTLELLRHTWSHLDLNLKIWPLSIVSPYHYLAEDENRFSNCSRSSASCVSTLRKRFVPKWSPLRHHPLTGHKLRQVI